MIVFDEWNSNKSLIILFSQKEKKKKKEGIILFVISDTPDRLTQCEWLAHAVRVLVCVCVCTRDACEQ